MWAAATLVAAVWVAASPVAASEKQPLNGRVAAKGSSKGWHPCWWHGRGLSQLHGCRRRVFGHSACATSSGGIHPAQHMIATGAELQLLATCGLPQQVPRGPAGVSAGCFGCLFAPYGVVLVFVFWVLTCVWPCACWCCPQELAVCLEEGGGH